MLSSDRCLFAKYLSGSNMNYNGNHALIHSRFIKQHSDILLLKGFSYCIAFYQPFFVSLSQLLRDFLIRVHLLT